MINPRYGSKKYIGILLALVVILFLILSILAPNTFPTGRNLVSMARQMAPIGLLSLAIAMAFLIGAIDLSIVAVANAAAISTAISITALESTLGGGATYLGVVIGMVIGLAAGLINGLLVAHLKVHPIPITLGTLTLFTGISTGVTKGSTQYGTGSLSILGTGKFLGIPINFLLFVLVMYGFAFLASKTRFGFKMYTVGASERVSIFSRMNVARVQVLTYMFCGLISAFAGILMFAETNAANVSFGDSFLIQAILIAVVSGMNPYGGQGRLILIIPAVAIMQQIQSGINLAFSGWSSVTFAAQYGWGIMLLLVLALGQRQGTKSSWPVKDGKRFWQTRHSEDMLDKQSD